MKTIRLYHKGISLFLAVLFTLYATGCKIYTWRQIAKHEAVLLSDKPLNLYIVDAATPQKQGWSVTADIMDKSSLKGTARKMSEAEIKSIRKIKGSKAERLSTYHLIFNVDHDYTLQLPDSGSIELPLDKVNKIELYEFDKTGSAVVTVFAVIGIAALVFLIIMLIALATKGASCPFVYADTPEGRVFQGEIYSGATYPQLERHDWLPLPDLQASGQTYRITLANKVHEIQHTNQLELVAVDHPENAMVLFDKYGQLQTMTNLQTPISATDLSGTDVLGQIIAEDDLRFTGPQINQTANAEESLLLNFRRPAGTKKAKLVVRAKNTLWMDYAHGLMMDEFGERAPKVREFFLKKNAEELRQYMLQQDIPLSVWLETTPGKWERADYFNVAGPMALKRDVLAIDLSKVRGETVRIKLGFGYRFWEIDYTALDFSDDSSVEIRTIPIQSAVDQHGIDQTAALRDDDARYYSQPQVNDEATITFPAPPTRPGLSRSLMLHAKGHYQILREPAPGKPGIRHLKRFAKPHAFPKFAREQWRANMQKNEIAFKKGQPDRIQ